MSIGRVIDITDGSTRTHIHTRIHIVGTRTRLQRLMRIRYTGLQARNIVPDASPLEGDLPQLQVRHRATTQTPPAVLHLFRDARTQIRRSDRLWRIYYRTSLTCAIRRRGVCRATPPSVTQTAVRVLEGDIAARRSCRARATRVVCRL